MTFTTHHDKRKFGRISRTLLLSGAVALSTAGQASAAARTTELPGRMVSIGTHSLHIHCTGSAQQGPTVVLEAGLGGSALEWTRVQSILDKNHRVCSYDRAGMGWSDGGPTPRASGQITQELHSLLQNAEIPAPYIVVGHSLGGYSAQLFAARYPELTAGLVLVDASHPEQIDRFAQAPVRVNIAPKGKLMFLIPASVPENIPSEVRETASGLLAAQKARVAVTQELQSFRLSASQVQQAGALPDVPLLVITRGLQKWARDDRGNRMEALWQTLQVELARRTTLAAQIIARESGHHIHLDQPQLVADAIGLMADAARLPMGGSRQRAAMVAALQSTSAQFQSAAAVDLRTLAGAALGGTALTGRLTTPEPDRGHRPIRL